MKKISDSRASAPLVCTIATIALALLGELGGCMSRKSIDSLDYEPSPLAIGPLTIGVWLPAGLNQYHFGPEDQEQLAELGINYLEWLQRASLEDGSTAEEAAMEFCNRTGIGMPVYYEPPGYTSYDKLHNWAIQTEPTAEFEADLRKTVEALFTRWEGNSGFRGYLVGHEDYSESFYSPLRQTVEALRLQDPSRSAVTVGSIVDYQSVEAFMDSFFVPGGQPNVFQHELYVLRSDTPYDGKKLQRQLDRLVESYEQVARHMQGRHGRWHAIVQTMSVVREGRLNWRKPTASEIGLQAGMALTRGAAGIIYFLYSSGLEEIFDEQGNLVLRRTYEGLVNEQGEPTSSYRAVQELNGLLRRLSPVLEDLHYHGGFSSREFRRNPLVLAPQVDLEFGLFGNGVAPSHVLVVNRQTQNARRVQLSVGGDRVQDALSGARLEVVEGKVVVPLNAGGLRLLEVRATDPGE